MATNDTAKLDFLWKLSSAKASTSPSKQAYEEALKGSTFQVSAEDVWVDSSLIPPIPPGGTTSVVQAVVRDLTSSLKEMNDNDS